MSHSKTLGERALHAILFETFGVMLIAPLAALLTGVPLLHMGGLAILLSTSALLWSMAFNYLFDRVTRRRTLLIRSVHAVLFEGGFILIAVPLAAAWLGTSWREALLLDIGFILFYLPYTFLYNLAYDLLRPYCIQSLRRAT